MELKYTASKNYMNDLPKRTEKALTLDVVKVNDDYYLVHSQTNNQTWYHVEIKNHKNVSCTCPDYEHGTAYCKHIRASALADATGKINEI